MITEGKVIEIFCLADDFCKHLLHLFPKTVSYDRFVELQIPQETFYLAGVC